MKRTLCAHRIVQDACLLIVFVLCINRETLLAQSRNASNDSIALCTEWRDFTLATQSSSLALDGRYVWVGTIGGLVRFDTVTKKHDLLLKTNTGDPLSGCLPVNWVTSLVRDRARAIWAGTWCGGVARYQNGVWTKFNTHNSGLPDTLILSLALDSSGNVWAGTASGLAKFSGGTFTVVPMPNLPVEYRAIYSMAVDPSGNLWVGAQAGNGYAALNKFDGITWTEFRPQNSLILDQYIFSVAAAPNGTIWIGFQYDVMESFDGNSADAQNGDAWTVYVPQPGLSGMDNPVGAITVDDSGAVWTGNYLGSAMLYDGKWKTFSSGQTSAIAVNGGTVWFANDPGLVCLQSNSLTRYQDFSNSTLAANEMQPPLTVDKNGCTWTATWGNVNLAVRTDTGWTVVTPPQAVINPTNPWGLAADSSGNVWAGISAVGVARYDGSNWDIFDGANAPSISTGVGSIAYDKRSGKVWVGTNKGFFSFDGQAWTTYTLPSGFYSYNGFDAMAIDDAGNVWACSFYSGVVKFDGTTWQVFTPTNSGLPSNMVMGVACQRSGAIWIATNSGLARYENGTWTVFNTTNSPIPVDAVTAVAVDTADRVWAGTFGYGAACYDHGNWKVYNQDNSGLTNWHIQSIEADARGNIWFAHEYAGLAEFNNTGFGSVNPLFVHDTVSACNGATLQTLSLSGDGCTDRHIIQQRIAGNDSAFYQIEHAASLNDITQDSIVVAFTPDSARAYHAALLVTLEDGTTFNIPLAGYGVPSTPISLSTTDAINDTIGATIDVPIVISNSGSIQTAELTIAYDTAMLVYRGSVSSSGNALDDGIRSTGQSNLHIDASEIKSDTVAYARFQFYPTNNPCTNVTLDSLVVTSNGTLCSALANTSAISHICSSNGCGNAPVSEFLRYGSIAALSIQPNPAGREMLLHASSTLGPVTIDIIDQLGISRQHIIGKLDHNQPMILDLQHIPEGWYYLKITSPQFSSVIPFVHYEH